MGASRLRIISHNFNLQIKDSYKLIKFTNEALEDAKLSQRQANSIFELAFLRVYLAWERFLEDTFVAYMCGARTKTYKPEVYLKKIGHEEAYNICCKMTGTGDYPDMTDIKNVCESAELFFRGGMPFSLALKEIEVKFNEMKKIRNAIVHASTHSKRIFEGVIRSNMPAYRINITPGEFLNSTLKRHKKTYFEDYISRLEVASKKIVPPN